MSTAPGSATDPFRRSIVEFRDRHHGEDIWVIGSAASMDHVQPKFFDNKIAIGVNDVWKKFRCSYLVRKEQVGAETALYSGLPLILSRYDRGTYRCGRNTVSGVAWYFEHEDNRRDRAPDLSVVGTDRIVVSRSTMTSALHVAAYMGAASILVCGHDGGLLDGRLRYNDYYAGEAGAGPDGQMIRRFMQQSRLVRDRLEEVYGCCIHSLNPFLGYDLDGHQFQLL